MTLSTSMPVALPLRQREGRGEHEEVQLGEPPQEELREVLPEPGDEVLLRMARGRSMYNRYWQVRS